MEIKNAFIRCDDYVDKGRDFSDSIVKEYVLVDAVKHLNPNDPEDFIIVKVPKLVRTYDMSKEINEAAKGTDLKSLVMNIIRTGGDISQFDIANCSCGDASMIANDSIDPLAEATEAVKGVDKEILQMTPEQFEAYIQNAVNQALENKAQQTEQVEQAETTTEQVEKGE